VLRGIEEIYRRQSAVYSIVSPIFNPSFLSLANLVACDYNVTTEQRFE
jgi:hypothetical protein